MSHTDNITHTTQERLLDLAKELRRGPLDREQKRQQLLSMLDSESRNADGMRFLYDHIVDLVHAGIFTGTPWQDAGALIPYLVRGTLCAPFPNNVLEILSELRILKIATGDHSSRQISRERAVGFLVNAIVSSFDLPYRDLSRSGRLGISDTELSRIRTLFDFIDTRYPFSKLKERLAEEVDAIAAHRHIITTRLEEMLRAIERKVPIEGDSYADRLLTQYVDALLHPTPLSLEWQDPDRYIERIRQSDEVVILEECATMGEKLESTGLVSEHQLCLLRYLSMENPQLIPVLLHLNEHGKADFSRHNEFVLKLIREFVVRTNRQAIYGLKKMLQRNLLSRKPVWNAMHKLITIDVHPQVAENLQKSAVHHKSTDPLKLLVGGVISVLGQPLGIGQGNNPICQSARGISMWSQHSPAKLLNLIIDTSVSNRMQFRYEGELIESDIVGELDRGFDLNLDPVSIVLVSHMDSIYGKMMRKAMIKHIGKDPHISVNPAFYGHWIQTGFISCYNSITNAIERYDHFVRILYASFHPEYNGGHSLIYPVPVGIFITSSNADFQGFHAISLLRVQQRDAGEWRAYFFNPNNEGRQDWGQNIRPTVTGHGEAAGESSLPFHQLAARIYAFHFNSSLIEGRIEDVPGSEVRRVTKLARESWGKKYLWL